MMPAWVLQCLVVLIGLVIACTGPTKQVRERGLILAAVIIFLQLGYFVLVVYAGGVLIR